MQDWRSAADDAFCDSLTKEEWAWQFLRRNPEYRADYAWFITTWQALEAEYGVPPERDYFRWRRDPRAWRSETELTGCDSDTCPGIDDKVLIECWMGAKWGFRKFPLDPDRVRPEPGAELAWREQPLGTVEVTEANREFLQRAPGKIALGFDLSLPLAPQLAAAKIKLVVQQRSLERAGALPPRTTQAGRSLWTRYLRLLDGEACGVGRPELAQALGYQDIEADLVEAHRMCAGGYRRILLLEN